MHMCVLFSRLISENMVVHSDGEFFTNLRYADDTFLCTDTPHELQRILQNYPLKLGEWV